MHSSIFTAAAAALLLTPMAANAVATSFLLASDMVCGVTEGGSDETGGIGFGDDCWTGALAITESGFDCHNLQNPWLDLDTSDNYNTFHVSSDTGSICGVQQWDAYKDCPTCTNWGLYVSGGDGTKVGYCYPNGQYKDTCYAPPFSTDVWGEFVRCDIWDAPSAC